jgi:hypothetical protein
MHCVKLLGQRPSTREFDRQDAEFQIRVAVLDVVTALRIRLPGEGEILTVSRFVQQSRGTRPIAIRAPRTLILVSRQTP